MELLIILHQVSIHLGKEWWEKQKNEKFGYCSCEDCSNLAKVGAHVKIVNGGYEWYTSFM